LEEPELVTGPGFAYLRYKLTEPPVGRKNRLELKLATTLRRRQGWYAFRSTRMVTDEVELQLIAPFRTYLFSENWWTKADCHEDWLGARRFSSKITIPGPFPAGPDLVWLFEPETEKES